MEIRKVISDIKFWFKKQWWWITYSLKVKEYYYRWDICDFILYSNFEAFLIWYKIEFFTHPICDWEWEEGHIKAKKEMNALFNWWIGVRPLRHDTYEKLLHEVCVLDKNRFVPITGSDNYRLESLVKDESKKEYIRKLWNRVHKLDDMLHEQDIEMLQRLIKIKDYLWT